MDHSCPHCSQPLNGKLLKSKAYPGERSILPDNAYLVCPFCGGGLKINEHPITLVYVIGEIAIGGFAILIPVVWGNSVLTWALFILGIALANALGAARIKGQTGWKKYEAFTP